MVRDHGRPGLARATYLVVLALCALTAIALAVLAIVEGFGSDIVRDLAVPLLGLLLLASAAALWGWREDARASAGAHDARARAEQAAAQAEREKIDAKRERAEAEQRIEETSREKAQAEQRVEETARAKAEADRAAEQERRRRDEEVHREREGRLRSEQGRRLEREWTRELREQIFRLHRENGVLGSNDVRDLVLKMAVELLDAEKGLLLSREDTDGDGDLELVRSIGFDNDPAHSVVTQRLATRVLDRDEILHEDDRSQTVEDGRTAADDEIDNLVAIPVYIADEFSGVIVCVNREGGFAECEDDVLVALGDHTGALLQNGKLHGELRSAYLATVQVLSQAIEAKDPFLGGHSEDVAALVAAVADKVGVEHTRREELVFGSLLHDVGKLGISERILLKPGPLTPEEHTAVRLHPRIGFRMIERVPALRSIAPAVLYHHEWFDGNGYPTGLRGEDIPLEARIVAVADCFSAMTTDRPYRSAMTPEEACEELIAGAGTQFDPEVVTVFVEQVRSGAGRTEQAAAMEDSLEDPELRTLIGRDGQLAGAGAVELTDSLTLLASHRRLHEVAAAEAQRAALHDSGFALVVGELAGIEDINRTHGFAAGDEAIRNAARAFERAAQSWPGAVAARLSGRKLALLAGGAATPEALQARLATELDEGPDVRLAGVAWATGEDGFATVGRALAGVAAGRIRTVSG